MKTVAVAFLTASDMSKCAKTRHETLWVWWKSPRKRQPPTEHLHGQLCLPAQPLSQRSLLTLHKWTAGPAPLPRCSTPLPFFHSTDSNVWHLPQLGAAELPKLFKLLYRWLWRTSKMFQKENKEKKTGKTTSTATVLVFVEVKSSIRVVSPSFICWHKTTEYLFHNFRCSKFVKFSWLYFARQIFHISFSSFCSYLL